ncbi:MAG: restriction endonuclease subunit S [Armatimonadetes bacterium]|nr:restriction endonuclease subunit S [Armatimonadota bacterium]
MKKGWQQIPMGQLCSISSGDSDTQDAVEDGAYAFFDRSRTVKKSSRFLYDCEALIIPGEGKEFLPRHFVGKFDLHQRAYALFDFTIQIDPRFLYFYLHHFSHYLPSVAVGATVKSLRRRHFEQLPVAVTTLAEQQRIVGVLDEAFAGLATAQAHAEKNLQNARALFESHLQSVFTQRGNGWAEKRLEEIGKTQTGSTPKSSDPECYGDFIPFVKPADFNKDGSLDCENDGLSKKGLDGARKVAAGSVLMVCIGATIGKCGYCDCDVTTNQQINALTPSAGVSHKFIYYQMLTESFQRSVMHSSAQATLPIINKSKWSALAVALPPKLEEQKQIVAKFDALATETQRLARHYQQKQAALAALKKSLLHQAFTGEL